MTNLRTYTLIILVIFTLMAVFGLYLPFVGMGGHDMGCPFSFGGEALCPQTLAHVDHWQNAFLTILVEIFILGAFASIVGVFFNLFPEKDPERYRYRIRASVPIRPTLFQELFTRGILNRRAP
jgi:hypothetical protein